MGGGVKAWAATENSTMPSVNFTWQLTFPEMTWMGGGGVKVWAAFKKGAAKVCPPVRFPRGFGFRFYYFLFLIYFSFLFLFSSVFEKGAAKVCRALLSAFAVVPG